MLEAADGAAALRPGRPAGRRGPARRADAGGARLPRAAADPGHRRGDPGHPDHRGPTCARRWMPSRRAPTTTSPSPSTRTRSWAWCARPPAARLLEREVHYLRPSSTARRLRRTGGRHPRWSRLYELIAQVAQTPPTVLITGESGTGKELVARAHPRRARGATSPFVAVNCAAIPDDAARDRAVRAREGRLHRRSRAQAGKFELAHGGTLFLDEVGEPARRPPGQAAPRPPAARPRAPAGRAAAWPGGRCAGCRSRRGTACRRGPARSGRACARGRP